MTFLLCPRGAQVGAYANVLRGQSRLHSSQLESRTELSDAFFSEAGANVAYAAGAADKVHTTECGAEW